MIRTLYTLSSILGSRFDEEEKYDIDQHNNMLVNTIESRTKSMKSFKDEDFIEPIGFKDIISEHAIVMTGKEDYKVQEEILKKIDQKGNLVEINSGKETTNMIKNPIKDQPQDTMPEQLNLNSKIVDPIRDFHINSLVNFKLHENYKDKSNATSICQSIITLLSRNEEEYNSIISNLFIKSNVMVLPDEILPGTSILDSKMGSLFQFYNVVKDMEPTNYTDIVNIPEMQLDLNFFLLFWNYFAEQVVQLMGKDI